MSRVCVAILEGLSVSFIVYIFLFIYWFKKVLGVWVLKFLREDYERVICFWSFSVL